MEDFISFPKIPRLSRNIVITEKIDGTNAQILVTPDESIFAGSRKVWITPEKDNFGFAAWVEANKQELLKLGPGRHFGEWWGSGIQRGYGLKEKRFSLFNIKKWADNSKRPKCCYVVPLIYTGPFDTDHINDVIAELAYFGSFAAPGFMRPEGIVIFHSAGSYLFKKTVLNDEKGKEITNGST